MSWNKRVAKRRTLIFYLEVWDVQTNQLAGRIGDLTENGMMLLSNQPIEIESEHDFVVKIPDELGLNIPDISVHGTIQWVRPDKNPSVSCMGCRFAPLNPETTERIRKVIERMGFADNHLDKRLSFSKL